MLSADTQLVSVDDHVIEPRHMFVDHIAAKYRDIAPRIVEQSPGVRAGSGRAASSPSRPGQRPHPLVPRRAGGPGRRPVPRRYADMIPAAYDVHERVQCMDEDGVMGRAAVPAVPPLRRQPLPRGHRQGPRARVRAGVERLDARRVVRGVPRPVHPPTRSADLGPSSRAGDERVRGQGRKGIIFVENPYPLGLPSFLSGALGAGVRAPQRHRARPRHAHRHVVGPACRRRPTPRRRSASPCAA